MRESGEDLVATLDIREGMDVLDLGCGDMTTALPCEQAISHPSAPQGVGNYRS
jgi:ubiquinone/menaquinone biosynthesis C-methylase UbiE